MSPIVYVRLDSKYESELCLVNEDARITLIKPIYHYYQFISIWQKGVQNEKVVQKFKKFKKSNKYK